MPSLRTPRLILRGLALEDLEPYRAMVGGSPEAAEQRLARLVARHQAGEIMSWAITARDRRAWLGIVGLCRFEAAHARAEVAYELRPEFRRQGFATEAVAGVVRHAFETLELHRVEGHVEPSNLASCRVLEKNGFEREGVLRQNHCENGVWLDTVIYGRLASVRVPRAALARA